MKAIHVSSFAPSSTKRQGKPDLYGMVLSALTWRKYNGGIDLICDEAACGYYERLGITAIWGEVRTTLPCDLEGINPQMFWAAGKLLALRETGAPVVMLDNDFIVWKKLAFGNALLAAHREELHPDVYPVPEALRMKPGYMFNPAYNYNVLPLNTAFLYLPDEDFKQYYVNMALEFMKSAQDTGDNLRYMVYAEQRLLALCAEYLNIRAETLLDKDSLFERQERYTHLWGEKQAMREDPGKAAEFCARCAARIRKDYPEYNYIINLIEGEANGL
jgi:hypothetical protein